MKQFTTFLLIAMLAQLVLADEWSPEQVEVCLKQADNNAEKIYVESNFNETCTNKSFKSLKILEKQKFLNECKEINESVHFAIIETDCSYDLEKLINAGKAKPEGKLAQVVAMRDYCQESKESLGLIGKMMAGDSSWFSDLLDLGKKIKF